MTEDKPKSNRALLTMATLAAGLALSHDPYYARSQQAPEKKAPPSAETREARHRQKMARKKQRRAQR